MGMDYGGTITVITTRVGHEKSNLTPNLTKDSKSPAASTANSARIMVLVILINNTRSVITVKREVLKLAASL